MRTGRLKKLVADLSFADLYVMPGERENGRLWRDLGAAGIDEKTVRRLMKGKAA